MSSLAEQRGREEISLSSARYPQLKENSAHGNGGNVNGGVPGAKEQIIMIISSLCNAYFMDFIMIHHISFAVNELNNSLS